MAGIGHSQLSEREKISEVNRMFQQIYKNQNSEKKPKIDGQVISKFEKMFYFMKAFRKLKSCLRFYASSRKLETIVLRKLLKSSVAAINWAVLWQFLLRAASAKREVFIWFVNLGLRNRRKRRSAAVQGRARYDVNHRRTSERQPNPQQKAHRPTQRSRLSRVERTIYSARLMSNIFLRLPKNFKGWAFTHLKARREVVKHNYTLTQISKEHLESVNSSL